MTEVLPNQEFPDVYFELQLTSRFGDEVPALKVTRCIARLEGDFYHCPRKHHSFKASELMQMTLSEGNPCRWIKCLEQDIDRAVLVMRTDILREVRTLADRYNQMLEVFHREPEIVGDDVGL